jgi:2-phospho-L-lactate guanylyltransferase
VPLLGHEARLPRSREANRKGVARVLKDITVIVPFKGANTKTRLSTVLDEVQRRQLSLLMLREVLGVLAETGLAGSCEVVSPDRGALGLALKMGAEPVGERSNRGVNAAVLTGMKKAKNDGIMAIPADLPLLKASEIRAAVALKSRGVDVVLSPSSSFDGTNLLLFSRDRPLALSYDRNSFWNHLADAAKKGLSVAIHTGRGVMFDIDTVDDLKRLGQMRIRSPPVAFAKRALRKWNYS